jgi:hypothetical protein
LTTKGAGGPVQEPSRSSNAGTYQGLTPATQSARRRRFKHETRQHETRRQESGIQKPKLINRQSAILNHERRWKSRLSNGSGKTSNRFTPAGREAYTHRPRALQHAAVCAPCNLYFYHNPHKFSEFGEWTWILARIVLWLGRKDSTDNTPTYPPSGHFVTIPASFVDSAGFRASLNSGADAWFRVVER